MRSLLVALGASLLLSTVAAPAAAIGIPILDNLWFWPDECGEQAYWFYAPVTGVASAGVSFDDEGHAHAHAHTTNGAVNWERHCEGGVQLVAPTGRQPHDGTDWTVCLTCRVLP